MKFIVENWFVIVAIAAGRIFRLLHRGQRRESFI